MQENSVEMYCGGTFLGVVVPFVLFKEPLSFFGHSVDLFLGLKVLSLKNLEIKLKQISLSIQLVQLGH